jgi:hypothetical protein
MGLVLAPRAGPFTLVKETRHPFFKRLGGPRGLSGRVWRAHPYQYSNPRPSITQRVATCIMLSGPTLYKSKEDSYGTTTIFSTSDAVKAPKNINFNISLKFVCSFNSLNLSSNNVRSLLLHVNIFTIVVILLLGDSPASEFYRPTFRNILSVPSS